YHSWGPYDFDASAFGKRLHVGGSVLDAKTSRNPSLRVNSLTVSTSGGSRTFTGADVRDALGLRSTFFSVGVLDLEKPSQPLVYGVGSPLSGIARAISNPRIERLDKGKWTLAAPVDRDPDATFTVAGKSTAKASYRLSGSGTSTAPLTLGVSAYVRLDPAASTTELSGRARPIVQGAAVTIQRNTGSGWTTISQASLDASGHFAATVD